MTKKTKYEKPEGKDTLATFDADEVFAFAHAHAVDRRGRYLAKVAQRQPNPLLVDGREKLSPISMVAEADMMPLSTRQMLGRFVKSSSPLENGDGYDTETPVDDQGNPLPDHDADYHARDRVENPPTPHEVRAYRLSQKLSKARADRKEAREKAREAGSTLPSQTEEAPPGASEGPKDRSKQP